jgi:hypothetical protein
MSGPAENVSETERQHKVSAHHAGLLRVFVVVQIGKSRVDKPRPFNLAIRCKISLQSHNSEEGQITIEKARFTEIGVFAGVILRDIADKEDIQIWMLGAKA